jgi:catechol 2,3-dioxygenase-like lactoylglutathione lyase family enzyme
MIRVSKLISRPDRGETLRLSVSGICGVTIPVRDLDRSVAFYSRVFGFRVVRWGRTEPRRSATLTGPGDALLAIHESDDSAVRPAPVNGGWGFLVDELDRVREAVWDLGVKVADDNGEPDHIHRWSNGRSLRVRDPDGNEIELIEAANDHAAEMLRRCPGRAVWRRWVRQECGAR